MTHTAKVRIHWLAAPPVQAQRIVRPARFDHQGEDWKKDAWSLVVDTENAPDTQGYQVGTAKFLSPEAPHDWLTEGKRFTLFAEKAIAEGEVIPSAP
jgi:hypothetical protein